MRYTLIFILFAFQTSLWAQVQMLNPTSYPFLGKDTHLFDDGEMYATTWLPKPYLIKVRDVDRWPQTTFTIIEDLPNNLSDIHCFSKAHCWAWASTQFGGMVGFESLDSGKTWQFKQRLSASFNLLMPVDSLFVVDDPYSVIRYSLDGARTWINPPARLGLLKNCGQSTDTVYAASASNDSIYRLTRQGFTGLARPEFPDSASAFFVKPLKNGYAVLTDSGNVYQGSWYLDSLQLIHQFSDSPQNVQFFRKGDTAVFRSTSDILFSTDLGMSWQWPPASSQVPMPYQARFFRNGKLHFHQGHGFLSTQSIFLGDTSWLPFNRHPFTNYFYPMGEQRFFAPIIKSNHNFSGLGTALLFDTAGSESDQRSKPFGPGYIDEVVFADSVKGVVYERVSDQLAYTTDGAQSWQYFNVSPFSKLSNLAYSDNGNCLFSLVDYSGTKGLSRISSGNQLMPLPLQLGPGETMEGFYFQSCDTGIALTAQNIYYTTNGGQNFAPMGVKPGGLIKIQLKQDSVFIAGADSIIIAPSLAGPYNIVAQQPIANFAENSLPYHFFNSHQLISYYTDISRLVIADTRTRFQKELHIPVGQVWQILPVGDRGLLITGRGGQLYRVDDYRALFSNNPIANHEEVYNHLELQVFPNPASNSIRLVSKDSISFIALYNLSGQRVLEQRDPENHISVKNLQPGIYLLKVKLENGRQVTRRIVIEHQ